MYKIELVWIRRYLSPNTIFPIRRAQNIPHRAMIHLSIFFSQGCRKNLTRSFNLVLLRIIHLDHNLVDVSNDATLASAEVPVPLRCHWSNIVDERWILLQILQSHPEQSKAYLLSSFKIDIHHKLSDKEHHIWMKH